MHERNIYRERRPDFKTLSEEFPKFAKHVQKGHDGKCHINFRDAEAVKELSCALLLKDFALDVEMPLDRLIPTIPLRLNYVHWVEDLLGPEKWKNPTVKGIDIGCGASCIYPLLGTRINYWKFIASEIDERSFKFAKINIDNNKMNEKIDVRKVNKDDILIGCINNEEETFDFTMCNPPFYGDRWEASGEFSRTDRRTLPWSMSTASENESITQGGEVEFVKKIMTESFLLKDRISWFTSLIGKKSSLKLLLKELKDYKVPIVTSTEFQQGKTTRWGIAWSFSEHVKVPVIKKKHQDNRQKHKPFIFSISNSELEKRTKLVKNDMEIEMLMETVVNDIEKYLVELEVDNYNLLKKMIGDTSVWEIKGKVHKATWTHQRNKRRVQQRKAKLEEKKMLERCKISGDNIPKNLKEVEKECYIDSSKASEADRVVMSTDHEELPSAEEEEKEKGRYRESSRTSESVVVVTNCDAKINDTKSSDTKSSDTKCSDTKSSDTKSSDTKNTIEENSKASKLEGYDRSSEIKMIDNTDGDNKSIIHTSVCDSSVSDLSQINSDFSTEINATETGLKRKTNDSYETQQKRRKVDETKRGPVQIETSKMKHGPVTNETIETKQGPVKNETNKVDETKQGPVKNETNEIQQKRRKVDETKQGPDKIETSEMKHGQVKNETNKGDETKQWPVKNETNETQQKRREVDETKQEPDKIETSEMKHGPVKNEINKGDETKQVSVKSDTNKLIFEFVISISQLEYFDIECDDSCVGVSFFCIEGDLQQSHQMFLYLKNQFKGIQVHKTKF